MRRYLIALGVAGLCALPVHAITVGVDPGAPWLGFMNVSETPANGGAYVFGSGWGTSDLTATFDPTPSNPTQLTLGPNSVNDTSSFWYTPSGGPGATGNKIMDASMYVETTGTFAGQTVTFSGTVLSNTLISPYTSVAFIKDFAPDYSSFVQTTASLAPGAFSLSRNAINDAGRHVQYGFETIGPDVWSTDRGPVGTIAIAVPEPTSIALIGVGLAGIASRRVRRQ